MKKVSIISMKVIVFLIAGALLVSCGDKGKKPGKEEVKKLLSKVEAVTTKTGEKEEKTTTEYKYNDEKEVESIIRTLLVDKVEHMKSTYTIERGDKTVNVKIKFEYEDEELGVQTINLVFKGDLNDDGTLKKAQGGLEGPNGEFFPQGTVDYKYENGKLVAITGGEEESKLKWEGANFVQVDLKTTEEDDEGGEVVVEDVYYFTYVTNKNNYNIDINALAEDWIDMSPIDFFPGLKSGNLLEKVTDKDSESTMVATYEYEFDGDDYVKTINCKKTEGEDVSDIVVSLEWETIK